ncbi:MAG TPA: YciI family protein [Actinomycetes bacterium]|nr:YciI family protein [Actinomycetes bacterium]
MAKYLIAILGNQAAADAMSGKPSEGYPAWSPDEMQAMFKFMESFNNDLAESGEFVDAQGLAEPRQAVYLTAGPDGRPIVSDGPYSETREVFAGYWIVECTNIDRAIDIAKRVYDCPIPAGSKPAELVVHPILDGPVEL